MKTLVLGGVKSGKSRYAEQQVQAWLEGCGDTRREVIYVATAESRGDEFSDRIEYHRARRPADWLTIEEPIAIAEVIRQYADSNQCLLVECLTLWMSNLLGLDESGRSRQVEQFLEALSVSRAEVILVGNETGLGIMPANQLAREFGDASGVLHQRLAAVCNRVVVIVAGLPLELKKT